MKSNKAITLTTLVLTVIIILIITGAVIAQSINSLDLRTVNDLYNDLELLENRVNLYYMKYGTLPVNSEFTGSDDFKSVANPNDNSKYYVINLNMLDALTLNRKISGIGDDVYVINDATHTVYYPQGVNSNNKMYYSLTEEYTVMSNITDFERNYSQIEYIEGTF